MMQFNQDEKMVKVLNPSSRFMLFVNLQEKESWTEVIKEFSCYGMIVYIRRIKAARQLMMCVTDRQQAAQLQLIYNHSRGAFLIEENLFKISRQYSNN